MQLQYVVKPMSLGVWPEIGFDLCLLGPYTAWQEKTE